MPLQPPVETTTTDILIVGSSGAGLFAALHAYDAHPRSNILVTVKGLVGKSGCTRMAQGGYNVVLNPHDSLDDHFRDTITGGAYLNHQELAWTLVKTAPECIRELETRMGCFFDCNPDGTIHQKAFAGQSFDRTVHRGDLTGIEIMNRLMEQVLRRGIARLEDHRAVALLHSTAGHGVAGALFVNIRRGMSCQPLVVGVGIGGTKDYCVRLAKEAACLRLIGEHHPDPEIAALEEELYKLGNATGFGAMGFPGDGAVMDVHIEIAYAHTGGMPVAVQHFCCAHRRMSARLLDDNTVMYREDPQWFTPYYRREGIE